MREVSSNLCYTGSILLIASIHEIDGSNLRTTFSIVFL